MWHFTHDVARIVVPPECVAMAPNDVTFRVGPQGLGEGSAG